MCVKWSSLLVQLSSKLDADFEDAIDEFEFLRFPDPDVDAGILTFYIAEFKKTLMMKLYCLVFSSLTFGFPTFFNVALMSMILCLK